MATETAAQPFETGSEHLLAELERIDLLLAGEAARMRAAGRLRDHDPFRGLYVPDMEAEALLNSDGSEPRLAAELAEAAAVARLANERRVGPALPLPRLARAFGLDRFEVDTLLLAVASEIDPRYEKVFGYVQNDITKKRPTVGLALALLCAEAEQRIARRAVFARDATLVREGLIELIEDVHDCSPPLTAKFLKLSDRIVAFLVGQDGIDERLWPFARRLPPERRADDLPVSDRLLSQLAHLTASGDAIIVLHGPPGADREATAEAVAATLGLGMISVELPPDRAETLVGLAKREAILADALLYLAAPTEAIGEVVTLLGEYSAPVVLGCTGRPPATGAGTFSVELGRADYDERLHVWRAEVESKGVRLGADVDLTRLAAKFAMEPGQIKAAVADAVRRCRTKGSNRRVSMAALEAAARAQSSHALDALAQPVKLSFGWPDLVLPRATLARLRAVQTSIEQCHVVNSAWGFGRKLSLGLGVYTLFSGPSGVGKTMAAAVLARDLGLDLYKIDLSVVVSKYIGETEKNLAEIFRRAQASNAILFFDEADALFGKRSEVRDSHDRYANIEIAYLLQKMEEHDGNVILATNLRGNVDDAFTRRLHHVVEFPLPDADDRERIWRGIFPPEAPLADDIDFRRLAEQFEFPGGHIRNVALAAAFAAAGRGRPIRFSDILAEAAAELEKLGHLPIVNIGEGHRE
jgi:hypothetical protein